MARRRGGQTGKGTFDISVTLDPSPYEIARKNEDLRTEILDFSPVWIRITPILRAHMGRVWSSMGAEAGQVWPAWKESYSGRKKSRSKRKHGRAMGILTGRLLQQLTTKGVLARSKTSMRFGARGPGVRAFHFGFEGQRARPYVVVTPGLLAKVSDKWNGYIREVMDRWSIKSRGRSATNDLIRRNAV